MTTLNTPERTALRALTLILVLSILPLSTFGIPILIPNSNHLESTSSQNPHHIKNSHHLQNSTYNALARITLKSYNSGIGTSLHYNPNHYRLERINTSNLQDLNYTFDNAGNILSIKDDVASETQSFTYDALDRILTASVSGGYSREYDYNSIGNIISVNSSGTVTNYTYGSGAGPHALTSYSNGSGGSCGCTGSQPPGSGDWNIDEDTSCSGSDIDISGGLNINNGNTLTLSGGTLYLDGDILLDGDLTLGSDIDFGGSGGSCSGGVTYNLTYDENGNVIEGCAPRCYT